MLSLNSGRITAPTGDQEFGCYLFFDVSTAVRDLLSDSTRVREDRGPEGSNATQDIPEVIFNLNIE